MLQRGDSSLDELARKQPPGRSRRAQDVLSISITTAGALVLLGAFAYRRLLHPEWTGGQALLVEWPYYLAGVLSIGSGWLLSKARSQ